MLSNVIFAGHTIIDWSSDSDNCKTNPSSILNGICRTALFQLTASNQLAQRLRQRFKFPADPRLSNPAGHIKYDGTLQLDLKFDPRTGPHRITFDLNRLKENIVAVKIAYQPRYETKPMHLSLQANLPQQNPISIEYDEMLRSRTNFRGVLKYSLNADDNSAEKTYQCDVDRPDPTDISISCQGERTKLTIDIDRRAGISKAYIDLNRFQGQRIGYEGVRSPQTKELDATLYTFVTSWNIKRQPGKSTTVTVKQNNQEVLRVEGTKVSSQEIQVKFSPANVHFK